VSNNKKEPLLHYTLIRQILQHSVGITDLKSEKFYLNKFVGIKIAMRFHIAIQVAAPVD
jgi:hypothetical protein